MDSETNSAGRPFVGSDDRGESMRAPVGTKAWEVPVIQRLSTAGGGYETRAATFVLELTSDAREEWVYLGDGERQMIEVSVESIRRIGSVLRQSFETGAASNDNGSTSR